MKAFRHFEQALAREHRAEAEAGGLSTKRPRRAKPAGKGGKRLAAVYVDKETHAALSALAEADNRTLANYIRRIFAREIERHAPLLAKLGT